MLFLLLRHVFERGPAGDGDLLGSNPSGVEVADVFFDLEALFFVSPGKLITDN